jgi:hypothetical protein
LPLNLKRGDWESTLKQEVVQKSKTTKEDVKSMYSHGNLRDRTLILVLAQSGFSEVDVSSFRIESLRGIYESPETEHFVVEKPREKTGEMQATCFSYEAMHDIRAMLQERGNPSEGYLFVSTTKGKDDKGIPKQKVFTIFHTARKRGIELRPNRKPWTRKKREKLAKKGRDGCDKES